MDTGPYAPIRDADHGYGLTLRGYGGQTFVRFLVPFRLSSLLSDRERMAKQQLE